MPRELVHWEILYSILPEIVDSAPIVHASLLKAHGSALLGAITPDAAYYLNFGGTDFEKTAELIHGANGEDTYEIPRKLFDLSKGNIESVAFAFGFLSHCVVDSHFHPLIYNLTGNYYALEVSERREARRRHRALEVYLDQYWKDHFLKEKLNEHTLSDAFSIEKQTMIRHCKILSMACEGVEGSKERWRTSLLHMRLSLHLCVNMFSGAALTAFNLLCCHKFEAEQALLTFGRATTPKWLETSIMYANPVTNQAVSNTIEKIRESARRQLSVLAVLVEEFIVKDPNVRADLEFSKLIGPSLNSGVPHSKKTDMQYFSPVNID